MGLRRSGPEMRTVFLVDGSCIEWRMNPITLQCMKATLTNLKGSLRTVVHLSYKIIGENTIHPDEPPILFLHGLLGSKKQWASIGKTIVNVMKKSVVLVDLRNHGESPHVNSHKYEELANDVFQLYEKLNIKNASLIGHDMGGRTAMCMSLIMPEKVANLLVVDMSPVTSSEELKENAPKILNAMKAIEFKHPKKVNRAKKDAKRQLKQIITDDITMSTVLSNINIKPDGTIGWTCNLDVLTKYIKHITSFPSSLKGKKYSGPTLFIGGQTSENLPPDDLIEIREMFPQAVIRYIPRTGHNLHVDDPKSFLELTISFLKFND